MAQLDGPSLTVAAARRDRMVLVEVELLPRLESPACLAARGIHGAAVGR